MGNKRYGLLFLCSCSRLKRFHTGKRREKHIRSGDRPQPIITPYPRASSAPLNVPATTTKGSEQGTPRSSRVGPHISPSVCLYNHNYTNRPIWPLCNLNYTSQTSVEIYGKQMVDFNTHSYYVTMSTSQQKTLIEV